jgi:hypothetical protein
MNVARGGEIAREGGGQLGELWIQALRVREYERAPGGEELTGPAGAGLGRQEMSIPRHQQIGLRPRGQALDRLPAQAGCDRFAAARLGAR